MEVLLLAEVCFYLVTFGALSPDFVMHIVVESLVLLSSLLCFGLWGELEEFKK